MVKFHHAHSLIAAHKTSKKTTAHIGLIQYHVISQRIFCDWLIHLPPNLTHLKPRQNGRHFADDIFKRIFFNENVRISIKNSLKFVTKGPINKIPALFQIMACRRPGDKPLLEAMLVSLLTHKCVTRPQWVNMRLKTKQWTFENISIGITRQCQLPILLTWFHFNTRMDM